MSFSNYTENRILTHIFAKGFFPMPTIYVGLHNTNPGESGGGEVWEMDGYQRVGTSWGDWSSASSGAITNDWPIVFPMALFPGWDTVYYFGLHDAYSGGNLLVSGALTTPYTITEGSIPYFDYGALVVTLD